MGEAEEVERRGRCHPAAPTGASPSEVHVAPCRTLTGYPLPVSLAHARMVAEPPRAARCTGVLQPKSLPPSTAPIATGWSDTCRAGFAPARRRRLSTAHRIERVSEVIPLSLDRQVPVFLAPVVHRFQRAGEAAFRRDLANDVLASPRPSPDMGEAEEVERRARRSPLQTGRGPGAGDRPRSLFPTQTGRQGRRPQRRASTNRTFVAAQPK